MGFSGNRCNDPPHHYPDPASPRLIIEPAAGHVKL
jgi:hypothetical protein